MCWLTFRALALPQSKEKLKDKLRKAVWLKFTAVNADRSTDTNGPLQFLLRFQIARVNYCRFHRREIALEIAANIASVKLGLKDLTQRSVSRKATRGKK